MGGHPQNCEKKSEKKVVTWPSAPFFLGKGLPRNSRSDFALYKFDKIDEFVVRMQLHYPGPDKTRLSISGPDHLSDSR